MIRNRAEQIRTEQDLEPDVRGTRPEPCGQVATVVPSSEPPNVHFRYLTTPDVAQMFQKTPRTIMTWVSEGLIPHMKIGRSILFDPDDVRAFMREHYRIVGGAPSTCRIKTRSRRRRNILVASEK